MNIPADYFIFKINILKKLILITLAVCLIAFLSGQRGFSLGFLVGGLLAMAIFSLLYKYVLALRNIQLPKRKKFIAARALLIFLLMGLALAIGIKKGLPVFFGTAAGIFSLKIAIFTQAFQEKHASA